MRRRDPTWRLNVKKMIERYPSLKRELESIRSQSMTANYSGMSGGSGVSRTTENVAMRDLPEEDRKEYDAVDDAIDITQHYSNGKLRMAFIKQYYWRQNISLWDICEDVHISKDTAYKWNDDFIRLVDAFYRKANKI